jgi:putative transcriptional regulator
MLTAGFDLSERFTIRPRSFDLIARKEGTLLVIKVVSHIDSVSEELAHDLEVISRYLDGVPLIVGERARESELERGAVYIRYNIYAVSPATLYDYFVEKIPPLVYSSPGGLYVNINSDALRELREKRNMSLGDLAQVLGVSRRTISKYESGMGTTLEMAIRLEEIFNTGIVESIDLMQHESTHELPPPVRSRKQGDAADRKEQEAPMGHLRELGMELHILHGAPFQALLTFEEHTILTGYGPAEKVVKRAALIGNLSQVAKKHAMCVITGYNKQKKIGRTLVIGDAPLHEIEDGFELLTLLGE